MTVHEMLTPLSGATMVVKFGGNAMVDDALSDAFAEDVVALKSAGVRVIVTHGGGPQISAELERVGLPSEFRGGLRYTTPDAALVVRRVLSDIGAELAARIDRVGGAARHVTGFDDELFLARRRGTVVDGVEVDLGEVGEVVSVSPAVVLDAVAGGAIPVVSASAPDAEGAVLNVNADSAAASLAVAVDADELVILTDVAGLYLAWPDPASLVHELDADRLRGLLPSLEAGMIPKAAACLDALDGGVARARIIDGRVPHPLTREALGANGTTFTPATETAPQNAPRRNA
ncbi:MAG: acetylglutamate kinase [Cryobacterium sp.]|nr:acetylglutamate kinase [Cryobacterium sp.]